MFLGIIQITWKVSIQNIQAFIKVVLIIRMLGNKQNKKDYSYSQKFLIVINFTLCI